LDEDVSSSSLSSFVDIRVDGVKDFGAARTDENG
jgi:hypothetical protein